MTWRRSSGSSLVESAVEPTTSQNITVSWRRSAAEDARGAAPAAGGGEGAGAATVAAPSLAPHCAQNFEPATLTVPHAAQAIFCGAPHCGQNLLTSGICAWQPGHNFVVAILRREHRRDGCQ